jgi:hypothetical protein
VTGEEALHVREVRDRLDSVATHLAQALVDQLNLEAVAPPILRLIESARAHLKAIDA